MRRFLLGGSMLFLLSLLNPQAGPCEEPLGNVERLREQGAPEAVFQDKLGFVAQKTFRLGQKRFAKIKAINDSYQWTSEAIGILATRGDTAAAISLLLEASEKFQENRVAYLLLGSILEKKGARDAAARAYADFYRYSLTLLPFEQKLISPSDLKVFRDYIEMRFAEWGMKLPASRITLDVQKARSVALVERSRVGKWINLILPLFVLLGLALMLLARMTGMEFPVAVSSLGLSFYFLTVLGYVLWVAHFFLGLPFFLSLGKEYALLFCGGTFLIVAVYLGSCFLDRRSAPRAEGLKYCPHCHASILNVTAECPVCKRSCRG